MRKFCERFRHLWWAPWQETKRCLICGAVIPVARTIANTETLTAKAGQTSGSVALPAGYYGTTNKLYAYEFGPFDIEGYYEGDMVAFWFDLVSKGVPNPTDINVWAIEVVGTKFVLGEPLFVS